MIALLTPDFQTSTINNIPAVITSESLRLIKNINLAAFRCSLWGEFCADNFRILEMIKCQTVINIFTSALYSEFTYFPDLLCNSSANKALHGYWLVSGVIAAYWHQGHFWCFSCIKRQFFQVHVVVLRENLSAFRNLLVLKLTRCVCVVFLLEL